jgi:hypothetical protein
LPILSLAVPPAGDFGAHFLYLHQLFSVRWAQAPSIAGWQDETPFQLGFAILAYSAVALWAWIAHARRSLAPQQTRLLAFGFGAGLLLVSLSLGWSAPLWQAAGGPWLLTYPWQILLLAAPLLALAAGCLPLVLPDFAAPGYWSVLVALVVLAGYPYLGPAYTDVQPPTQPLAMLGTNQLAVLSAQVTEGNANATLDVSWQVLQPLAGDDNVFFQAITGEGENERVVAQADAQPVGPEHPATAWQPGEILTGRYSLDLPPQAGELRYYFGFYDWRSGRRLAVDGGIDDKLVLHGE